jgi:photosystem II stability/assembly factor-like uncharacterized protein
MTAHHHRTGWRAGLAAGVLAVLLVGLGWAAAWAQEITPETYGALRYRYIGPPGNRTAAVAGVPGDPLVYYVGASSGGIWKSTDAGENWEPVFDEEQAQSIGALAVAASDPNVVWAGTGEAFVRSNISIGNGVYKSTDAGKTWRNMGLEKTGRIGRVAIDPRDPDTVFVAALGHCYGPQKERGVFRTRDGGRTWEQVLFVDENTGCFEIAMDPNNPRILFAGMWPIVIRTWGRESGGPNGGIWKSTDGGDTWKRLTGNGLPDPPIGKVGLAVAPSNSSVVYALIETGDPNRGVLWRSADGGDTWRLVSYNRLLNERPHYASRIMVNPADENEVYFAANSQSITLDGGYTTETVNWSGDCHDMWADPKNPDRLMLSDDGGVGITLNRGRTWKRTSLPNAQMYHVGVDNQIPYYVYGGMQDGEAFKGPSTGGRGFGFRRAPSRWEATAGGECGYVVPDPVDPTIVWGGSYNADLQRADYKTGHITTVNVWPESIYGSPGGVVKYRFNWTFPIAISPHDHNTVYVGSQYVHMTTDGGRSWKVISPDLTTNDASKLGSSGGLTKDNLAVEYGCVVFAIAESPVEKGCIWAGTNDGLVQVTHDGGKSWTNVTKSIPNLPVWGTVSNVEPSRYDAGTAYVTIDFHQMNNRDPFVYKTTDFGKTWTSLAAGIPKSVFSYCHWIHEDPVRKGLLYLGTENAIYVSFNDGKTWLPIQSNLPHAPVSHMVVQTQFNDLVVATYGRGFWIMDDVTPLQQLDDAVLKSDAYLFKPRPAYRLHPIAGGPPAMPEAFINYYLKGGTKENVSIAILDGEGKTIRRLRGSIAAGINRVRWDLRYDGPQMAQLRTRPPGNPHVVEEKRFLSRWESEGWYPIQAYGTRGGFIGQLVAPGTYTVKVRVGDKEYAQPLEVRKDPRSAGTVDDIHEQVKLELAVREDQNAVSGMINKIEWMRREIGTLRDALTAGRRAPRGRGRALPADPGRGRRQVVPRAAQALHEVCPARHRPRGERRFRPERAAEGGLRRPQGAARDPEETVRGHPENGPPGLQQHAQGEQPRGHRRARYPVR